MPHAFKSPEQVAQRKAQELLDAAKSVVPMTCETPLAAIERLRRELDYGVTKGRPTVALTTAELTWLLRDAQTLNELITKVHHS